MSFHITGVGGKISCLVNWTGQTENIFSSFFLHICVICTVFWELGWFSFLGGLCLRALFFGFFFCFSFSFRFFLFLFFFYLCYYCSLLTQSVLNLPILPSCSLICSCSSFPSFPCAKPSSQFQFERVSSVDGGFLWSFSHFLALQHVQYMIVARTGREVDRDELGSSDWAFPKKKKSCKCNELRTHLYQPAYSGSVLQ